MEESVLRGNAAILRCHISTFVTEYVSVDSWIVTEEETPLMEITADKHMEIGTTDDVMSNDRIRRSLPSPEFAECIDAWAS